MKVNEGQTSDLPLKSKIGAADLHFPWLKSAMEIAICPCRPVADWARNNGASQFLFVSSAGIYKNTEEPPHVEGVSTPACSSWAADSPVACL